MSAVEHQDYEKELSTLSYILKYVKSYYDRIMGAKLKIDKEVDYGVKHYNSDNAEQFNELIINTTLQENLSQKSKNLNKSLAKPYFARVDFKEGKSETPQVLYIGKISLLRDQDQELLIVDWRAPIATLYYEGRLGESSYDCPDGTIDGEIKLKRQYIIEKGELKEIYDIDITTNDDFLQAALGSSKDKRLKDIVSTIQAEQNKVIRADMWKPLIVQGAAGGGKTTIALHRIAYLMYNYDNMLSPKNFMIIAPNRFFLSYISEVLPDLGVENVHQTTFEDFAQEIIEAKLKLKPTHLKLSQLVNNRQGSSVGNVIIKKVSSFKSSLTFKDIICDYIKLIEDSLLPEIDFKIDSFMLLSYGQIRNLFINEYKSLPLVKRINEIKKHLVNTLKANKRHILEYVENKYDRQIEEIRFKMKDTPERRKIIIDKAETRDKLIEKIKKGSRTLVKDYLDNIKLNDTLEYYRKLVSDRELFKELCKHKADEKLINETAQYIEQSFAEGCFEHEDLAPLMMIRLLIFGMDEKVSVRHVVIDEAQDFSLFQLYVLKKIINSSSFTILGDLCQGIHSYRGVDDWNNMSRLIFEEDNIQFLTLEQSYRTTVEIMEAANSVIGKLKDSRLPKAKPVIRHGEPVIITEMNSLKEIGSAICEKLSFLEHEGYKSAAIICKTIEECKALKTVINAMKKDVAVITGTEKDYKGGIVIVPSYLVKGLEFDIVFIANASEKVYVNDELDIKLLYVAMTRPLHRLYIYSMGKITELLGVNGE
jgi:DNA helicase II / ATP-dependent DNA helicase PcrA